MKTILAMCGINKTYFIWYKHITLASIMVMKKLKAEVCVAEMKGFAPLRRRWHKYAYELKKSRTSEFAINQKVFDAKMLLLSIQKKRIETKQRMLQMTGVIENFVEVGECLDVKKQKGEWVSMKHRNGRWISIKEKDGEWRKLNGEEQCSVEDDHRYARFELDCIEGKMELVEKGVFGLIRSLGQHQEESADAESALMGLEVEVLEVPDVMHAM
jgi:hypothetical protein